MRRNRTTRHHLLSKPPASLPEQSNIGFRLIGKLIQASMATGFEKSRKWQMKHRSIYFWTQLLRTKGKAQTTESMPKEITNGKAASPIWRLKWNEVTSSLRVGEWRGEFYRTALSEIRRLSGECERAKKTVKGLTFKEVAERFWHENPNLGAVFPIPREVIFYFDIFFSS